MQNTSNHYNIISDALPLSIVQFYAAELVNALEYMKGKGVAHRNLKPENILLDSKYHIKLCDFECALIVTNDCQELTTKKVSSKFVGTAEYISPEILLNLPSGPASDIWALGCIIYQLLTGFVPFKGKTDFLTYELITKGEVMYPNVTNI